MEDEKEDGGEGRGRKEEEEEGRKEGGGKFGGERKSGAGLSNTRDIIGYQIL